MGGSGDTTAALGGGSSAGRERVCAGAATTAMTTFDSGPLTRCMILLADDDDIFRERLSRALRDRGLHVWSASCNETARALADLELPALQFALVDLHMPFMSGLQIIQVLRQQFSPTRLVLRRHSTLIVALDRHHSPAPR